MASGTSAADAHDVVVVGAGISGLVTTALLRAAGLDAVCLEARERVGGRLLSVPAPGGALDLGSTWFWAGQRRVETLMRDLGLPTHQQHTAGDALEDRPDGARRLPGNPIDVPAYRYSDGAERVAAALAATLAPEAVRLGAAATRITAAADGLVVTVGGVGAGVGGGVGEDAVHARQVVLALPPALAIETIAFEPSLPPQPVALASRTPVWMGAVTKVVAHYPEAFWRDAGLAGAGVSYTGPMRELHDISGPNGQPAAIFGFASPAQDGATVTQDAVLEQLIRLFGPPAGEPLRVLIQDWRREPFTSPTTVEALGEYGFFGHPLYEEPLLDGRLHWAGTETSAIDSGRVEGALAAAERAAAGALRGHSVAEPAGDLLSLSRAAGRSARGRSAPRSGR